MLSVDRLRAHIKQILHLDEPPHRTALAFAIGVFIAFSPAYGFHTIMVLACTWMFRLNFLALMAGALVNNPWTLVPILGLTLWAGFLILGLPAAPSIVWSDLSLESLYGHIMPYVVPFIVGGVALGVLGAVVAYPVAHWFVSRYRMQKHGASVADLSRLR